MIWVSIKLLKLCVFNTFLYRSKVSALLFSSGEQSKKGLKIHFSIVIFYETPLPNFSHIKDNPRTVLVHFQAI